MTDLYDFIQYEDHFNLAKKYIISMLMKDFNPDYKISYMKEMQYLIISLTACEKLFLHIFCFVCFASLMYYIK